AFAAKSFQQLGNYAYITDVDSAAERRLLAAADLVVAPSPYDATGSLPRKAQRYGAAPVAHARGAARDTVVDADADLETGTGFLYSELTGESLYGALARGIAAFQHPAWPRL